MTTERRRLLLKLYRKVCPDEDPLETLMTDSRGKDIANEMEQVVNAKTEQEAAALIRYWKPLGQDDWEERGAVRWVKRYRELLGEESGQGPDEQQRQQKPPRSQAVAGDGGPSPLKESAVMNKAKKRAEVPSLFTAEQIEERPAPPLNETGAVYIGLAYWSVGGWWAIKPDGLWTDVAKLRAALDALPSGWTHRRIYRLEDLKKPSASEGETRK
jgi:hypothetical protein